MRAPGQHILKSGECEDALQHYTKAAGLLAFVAPSPDIEEERSRLATKCKLNEVCPWVGISMPTPCVCVCCVDE